MAVKSSFGSKSKSSSTKTTTPSKTTTPTKTTAVAPKVTTPASTKTLVTSTFGSNATKPPINPIVPNIPAPIDERKPTLTAGSLEAPQPVVNKPTTLGPGSLEAPAPTETPKIEPTQVETANIIETPAQVTTDRTKVTKEETPTGTITTTETPKVEGITKDTKWETTDKSMSTLEQMVEARYGTIATQENGKIIADINGQKYEWTIGADGKPAKTLIGPSQTPIQLKAGDIFNQLLVNPNFNTQGYDVNEVNLAKSRYKNYNTFANMTDSQLSSAIQTGNLLKGSETYNDLMSNPALKTRLDNINKVLTISDKTTIEDKETTASANILNKNLTLKQALEDGTISGDEMKSMLQSEELTKLGNEKKERADEYTKLQSEYDQIEDQVRKELQGSGATSTAVEAEIFNRQKGIYPRLMLAKGLYENTLGAYNDEMDRAVSLFNTNLGLYKDSVAQANKIEDLKNQRLYEQGDINSTDPYLQGIGIENAVNNLYTVYPIPGMESPAVKIQKVKELMSKGLTGQQAITQVENEIRNSQRYKDYLASEKVKLLGGSTQDWAKLDDNTLYNQKTGETKSVTPDAPASTVTPTGTYTTLKYNSATGSSREMKVDKVATPSLMTALTTLGNGLVVGETFRTRERQQELYDAYKNGTGGLAAPPGQSKHEKGLAIDVYADANYSPLSPEQVKIMNANGWYQTAGEEDLGHFEYVGTKQETQVNQASLPLYRSYVEDGKLPSKDALKGMGLTSEQFISSADEGYNQYLTSKAKEISSTYPTLNVEFTPSYSTISATQREKLNESMTKIGDIDQRLNKLKSLFEQYGTEALPTKAKAEMQTLRQQIILKSKEVENLGVLNGPDLGILESLLPSTTGVISGLFSFDKNTKTKLNSIQNNYRSDAKTKGINYGARISFKDEGAGNSVTSSSGKTYTY